MKKDVQTLLKTLPEKIKIGAYTWTVEAKKDWVIGSDEKNKWGLCDPSNFHMVVGNVEGMATAAFFTGVLLHEIGHAIWHTANLRDRETEENVMIAFETGFVALYRDNPGLLDFIKKGVK